MKKLYWLFVNCLTIVLSLIAIQLSGQSITVNTDTAYIFCPPDTVCLDVTTVGGQVNTSSYTVQTIPFAPEPVGGTSLFMFDDQIQGPFPIGFDFGFFCNTYSQFYVCSNGWIGFSAGQPTTWQPAAIPSGAFNIPKNCIMGPWKDWNPSSGGQIRYQTLGSAPCRKLVVTWTAMPMFLCTGNLGTFQIVLHETTNVIDNHQTASPVCNNWAQGLGTQGIHDINGTTAYTVAGRNGTVWTATNDSKRFQPDDYVIWYENGAPIDTGACICVSPLQSTTYTVETTVSPNTCSGPGTLVNEDVYVDVSCIKAVMDSIDVVCTGDSSGVIIAEDTSSTLSGPYDFIWTDQFGDTIQITNNTNNPIDSVTNVPSGTYNVWIFGFTGGQAFGSVSVNEPDTAGAITFPLHVLCTGDSSGGAVAVDVSGLQNGDWSYYWTDINGDTVYTNLNSNSNTDTAYGFAAGTYDVFIDGCLWLVGSVTINEPPVLSVSIPSSSATTCPGNACDGEATALANGGTPPYNYSWNNGLNQASNFSLCPGTATVTVTDANGCTAMNQVVILAPDTIQTTASPDVTICLSNVASISASSFGGTPPYTYTWDNGVGTGNPVSVTPEVTTTYNVLSTDANGCPGDTSKVTVNVLPPLSMVLDVDPDTICPGDVATLSVTGAGGNGNYNFVWNNGAGVGNSVDVTPAVPTYYTVTITDGCGTPAAVDSILMQVGGYPRIRTTVTPDDTICAGDSVRLISAAAGGIGGPQSYTYEWDQGLGQGNSKWVKPTVTTTYTVTVTDECLTQPGIASITVNVGYNPGAGIKADITNECAPIRTAFKALANNRPGDLALYHWDFGDGFKVTSDVTDIVHLYVNPGCYDVTLTVTNQWGCSSSRTEECFIEVYPYPIADFDYSPREPSTTDPIVHFNNISFDAEKIEWDLGDGFKTTEQQFQHHFADSGIYNVQLVAINEYGCIDTLIVPIDVRATATFYVPSGFTPNGDGINDLFGPVGEIPLGGFYEMLIFDRWGNVIFKSNSIDNQWNGSVNNTGETVSLGVYAYVITYTDYTGTPREVSGSVTLARHGELD